MNTKRILEVAFYDTERLAPPDIRDVRVQLRVGETPPESWYEAMFYWVAAIFLQAQYEEVRGFEGTVQNWMAQLRGTEQHTGFEDELELGIRAELGKIEREVEYGEKCTGLFEEARFLREQFDVVMQKYPGLQFARNSREEWERAEVAREMRYWLQRLHVEVRRGEETLLWDWGFMKAGMVLRHEMQHNYAKQKGFVYNAVFYRDLQQSEMAAFAKHVQFNDDALEEVLLIDDYEMEHIA